MRWEPSIRANEGRFLLFFPPNAGKVDPFGCAADAVTRSRPRRARLELVNLSVLGFNFAVLPLLVDVTATVIYSWLSHREVSIRRNAAELRVPAHRQDVP
ncbi:hypothetical protein [Mycobacterium seoulense]|uniref:Uncharacterized protein n=1 Tax=Mycobacterium seoulense TaxID=386911 RepID=A0A7I7NVH2_9MYCO|nr:hypothetical protein [Mycobacterium seoulense]MCV7440534.1 hypothetical protein [Mycobacterium seoulense]BBY00479.1 hypothetical protein MSEO_09780 [Mycobacterium seoulense]